MAIDVGTAYVNILPSTRGLGKAIAGEFVAVDRQAAQAGESAGRTMGGGLKRAFKGALTIGGGLLAATGVAAIGGQFLDAINQAGELEQNVGALDAVFKGNAGQMNEWAKTAAQSAGLSRNEYSQLAVVLGSQLKNGGMAIEEIDDQTNGLIHTGADLASMFGGTTKEAVEAMSSALRGEMDPIERYGVSLSASKIESEAMALGLEKVNGELPLQAKQMAILSLINKQTADSQGNFARETDTLAGKQQIARAEWANLKTEIGERFLPAASAAMTFIREVAIPAVANFASFIGDKVVPRVRDAAGVLGNALGPAVRTFAGFVTGTLVPALRDAAGWVKDNRDRLVPLVTVIGSAVLAYVAVTKAIAAGKAAYLGIKGAIVAVRAAQFGLNIVMMANPIGLVIAAIVALGVAMVLMYRKSETFRNIVQGAWRGIQDGVRRFASYFTGFKENTKRELAAIGGFFVGLWQGTVRVYNGIRDRINGFLSHFRNIGSNTRRELRAIGDFFVALYNAWVRPAFDRVRARIDGFLGHFRNIGANTRRELRSIGDFFVRLYNNYVRPAWDNVTGKIRDGYNNVKRVAFDPLVRFVRDTIPGAFRAGRDAIGRHWSGLKSVVRGPIDFFVNTAYNNGLRNAVNNVLDFVGIDKRLPRMNMPRGFFRGGRTGGASPYEERGVVHGKEFVLDHRRTAEADRLAPGFLDDVHRHGFAAALNNPAHMAVGAAVYGGRGSFTNPLQYAIARTGELKVSGAAPGWDLPGAIRMVDRATGVKVRKGSGGDNTVHVTARPYADWWAGYYQGRSIYLNDNVMGPGIGRRTVAAHELGHALGLPHSDPSGIRSIMSYANMYQHNSMTEADVAALSAIYGGSGKAGGGGIFAALTDRFLKPFTDAIKGIMSSTLERFRGNIVGDLMGGIGKTVARGIVDWVKSKVPDFGGILPKLFDGGGLLTKGTHLVQHNQAQPDRVLSAQQWRAHYDIADWARRQQQAEAGGKLVENLYALDIEDALRKLDDHKRRREALSR